MFPWCADRLPQADSSCAVPDCAGRLHPWRSHRRAGWLSYDCPANGCFPRCFYKRSRYGNSFHCPRFCLCLPSGRAGDAGDCGGLSGYGCDLYHDGFGDSLQRCAYSLRKRSRRCFDNPSFCCRVWRLGVCFFGRGALLFCLCYSFGLGPLWHSLRRVSVWVWVSTLLCHAPGSRCGSWRCAGNRNRVAAVRDCQWSDGNSKFNCAGGTQPGAVPSDERISIQIRQIRCRWRYL